MSVLGLTIAAMTPVAGWDSRLGYLLTRPATDASHDRRGRQGRLLDTAGQPLSDHPAIFARLRLGSRCH